jgi:N-methylhydantoinase A
MESDLKEAMGKEFDVQKISYLREADMKYVGQAHSVRIPLSFELGIEAIRGAFEKEYSSRSGHFNPDMDLEFVTIRTSGIVPTAKPNLDAIKWVNDTSSTFSPQTYRDVYFSQVKKRLKTPVYSRASLPIGASITGPAIIEEFTSTTVIGVADRMVVGRLGELRITCLTDPN